MLKKGFGATLNNQGISHSEKRTADHFGWRNMYVYIYMYIYIYMVAPPIYIYIRIFIDVLISVIFSKSFLNQCGVIPPLFVVGSKS